jgi:hypothetical protein
MADSVQSDRNMPAVQAIKPANMADDNRLTTELCHDAVCFITQYLDARTPTIQAKLMLISAVAAACGNVNSIDHFTVKE